MTKIVQIRGSNGTGKTTLVREFLRRRGDNTIITLTVGGERIECHKTGEIIVMGRYDRNECGGCDSEIHSKELFKDAIAKIVRTCKPEVLIYEAVLYGKTFQFSYDIYRYAKAAKAEYMALCLVPAFETTLERIYGRNGGKEINLQALQSTYNSCIRSNAKLRAAGVPLIEVDTAKMTPEEMAQVLERTISNDRTD